jgi:hypothetical protein
MQVFWFVLLLLAAMPGQAASLAELPQDTHSWCSPAVEGARDMVYITCQGVSSQALDRLNQLLSESGLGLEEKLRKAEEWAWKYVELKQQLAAEGQENELARQAIAQLEAGNLEAVGKLVDQQPVSDEEAIDRAASHHYKRAHVYALLFKPLQALPHYEKAYRYLPDNSLYAHGYAVLLQEQNRYAAALGIYQKNLTTLRRQAKSDPAAYLPYVARTLNNLAGLYRATRRVGESEQALQEALRTYRHLAEANPAAYLPYVARTLNNLAGLYRATRRVGESEQALQEALQTYRHLEPSAPAVYLPEVAGTLNNLGLLYSATRRPQESEQALQEALQTYRHLAEANPTTYLPYMAGTLNNLALLTLQQDNLQQADEFIHEALTIRRRLWDNNPTAYGDELAQSIALEVVLLGRLHAPAPSLCSQLQEMQDVALSARLKQWARDKGSVLCREAKGTD